MRTDPNNPRQPVPDEVQRSWDRRIPFRDSQLVDRFTAAMIERLYVNHAERGKGGWESMTPKQLLRRAEQELGELRRAVETNRPASAVTKEAADVGNFCAMLATVYAGPVSQGER